MNPRHLNFQVQQSKAIVLPETLIKAMNDREGNGEAGLLLTRGALQTLDDYRLSVQRLPSELVQLKGWLGYEQIDEPELQPRHMQALLQQLRAHGDDWLGLREQCRAVTDGLQQQAASIEVEGAKVVSLVARTRALGANPQSWESLQQAPPVALDEHDLHLLEAMGRQLLQLHHVIDDYDRQVDSLRIGLEAFRNTAREALVPAIAQKCLAAQRFADSSVVSNLRWELDMLKQDIQAVRREYRHYSQQSSAGWIGGPFGFLISNSIYGPKAKAARAELHALERRQKQVSRRLAHHVLIEGRVNELGSDLQRLDIELWDVVLSTGHLHTAWQTVEAYLESSMERLNRMDTRQKLAIFIFHFRQFLSQWASIGEHARGMLKVFG